MTDTIKLKQVIAKSGLKTSAICERTGIKQSTLYNKLNDRAGEFTVTEAQALSNALNLTDKQRKEIFFAN